MVAETSPLISLVIPAWNESDFLPRLLDSVDAARAQFRGGRDRIEVIVADNGSTDDTASIAHSRGCTVTPVSRRCIASARNAGAAAATGELIAFADADFRIDPETFNFVADVMRRPGVVGGATGLFMERGSLGIGVTWYLIMPPLWAIGLDGGVWFCRRSDFQLIGGFDERVQASEDVRFLLALQRLGRRRYPRERFLTRFTARRIGFRPPLVQNSTRKFDKLGDWHMLRDVLRNLPFLLFGRRRMDEYIEQYWYRGRGPAVRPSNPAPVGS